ncbi:MAG: transporter substrate-binding domain-containing protein [Cellvibrionaceae bacterium]|nr:transporter substrate-binding domain-containing protein [Cellvibrionaceae bacterium]
MKRLLSNPAPNRAGWHIGLLGLVLSWALAAPQAKAQTAIASQLGTSSEPFTIWYFQRQVKSKFRSELISLALSYTQSSQPRLVLKPWPMPLTQQRAVSIMRQGKTPMLATLSAHSLFDIPELSRSKYPYLAGMLGLRLLVVRKQELAELATIEELASLRRGFKLGFGRHWRDYSILEHNGFRVSGTPQLENLFPMLAARRFDAIPRGLSEALKEQRGWGGRYPELALADSLVLYYPYPIYIHIHRNYQWALERIDYGLGKAFSDGSLEALYRRHFGAEIQWLDQHRPKLLLLANPYLSHPPRADLLCWWLPVYLRSQILGAEAGQCDKKTDL